MKTVSARDGLNEFDPHIQGTLTMAKLFGLFWIVLAIGCQPQDAPKTAVPRDAWDPPKGTAPPLVLTNRQRMQKMLPRPPSNASWQESDDIERHRSSKISFEDLFVY